MPNESLLESGKTKDLLHNLQGDGDSIRAWRGYRDLVLGIATQIPSPRILEVGGGRSPLLTSDEVVDLDCTYTVNDIDPNELNLAPTWVRQLPGDIADPSLLTDAQVAPFDLVFSRMVFEHVRQPWHAYANIIAMLAPGGIVINFVPTLYALPFVLNRLLPEKLAASVLLTVFPNRNQNDTPKFPAYYRWCTATEQTQKRLRGVGFSRIEVIAFYGHEYYAKFPILPRWQARVRRLASKRKWRRMSTFAFILCER